MTNNDMTGDGALNERPMVWHHLSGERRLGAGPHGQSGAFDVPGGAARVGQSLTQIRLRVLLAEIEARMADILGSTRDRVDALLDAVVWVSSGLDLDATLRRIVQAARDLVNAEYGVLGVLDSTGMLGRFVPVDLDDTRWSLIGPLLTGHGVSGVVIKDDKPFRLADLGQHPMSVGFPAHRPPMTTFLGITIRVRGVVLGRLYLTEKVGGKTSPMTTKSLSLRWPALPGSRSTTPTSTRTPAAGNAGWRPPAKSTRRASAESLTGSRQ